MSQERVLIAWNRISHPDALSLDLGTMPGADQAGYAGFSGGSHRWAVIASLVETCTLTDIEPLVHLCDVLEHMVNGRPASRLADLLPWHWKPAANA